MAHTKTHKMPYFKAFMPQQMFDELKTTSHERNTPQQALVRAAVGLYLDAMNGRKIVTVTVVNQRIGEQGSHLLSNPPPPRPPALRGKT